MNKKSKKNSYMQEEHVSLSDYYCKAPNLFSLTGYQNYSPMSFLVRKKK